MRCVCHRAAARKGPLVFGCSDLDEASRLSSPVLRLFLQTSWGHVQFDNCNFEGAQLQVRGPGTCQARFCSFSQGSSVHLLGVVLTLLDSCDFSGSDAASVTVEGPPVSERNWACKHLSALARTFPSPGRSSGAPAGFLDRSNAARPPPGAHLKHQQVGVDVWLHKAGVGAVSRDAVIQECWSEEDGSGGDEEDNPDGGGRDKAKTHLKQRYKIPCDNHGLSHLLRSPADGAAPAGSSSAAPGLLTLQQELDRDPEAQMLAASTLGCMVRRCLFRAGKGGVHLSNYGQARLEDNVFRELNYAVRCIQNSTVNKMAALLNVIFGRS